MNISLDKVRDKTETYDYEEGTYEYPKGFKYIIKTDKIKDVIKEEIERSQCIVRPAQYYIIAGGMQSFPPENPFLIPCYRSLFYVRKEMFASRYRGICEWDNHLWASKGWECDVYGGTVEYQITHHFYSAMTRDVIQKYRANEFPGNEQLTHRAHWLTPGLTDFVLDTVFLNKHNDKVENTQQWRDFLLMMIYLSEKGNYLSATNALDRCTPIVSQYNYNFPELFKTPEIRKKTEKSLRKKILKRREEKIKMYYLKMCNENRILARKKLFEAKMEDPKRKLDTELMLGIMCTREKPRKRQKLT